MAKSVIDVTYGSPNFPDGWTSALKVNQFRYIKYHCGFGSNPNYILKLNKKETISPLTHVPDNLTDDAYQVYVKRGNYVKTEVRLVKFGLADSAVDLKTAQIVPIYIETHKSPEKLKMFKIVKTITELVAQNKFKEALVYMKGFPVTPDILHFTRKCLNLMDRRVEVTEVTLDTKFGLRSWYHYDGLSQAEFELSAAHYYLGTDDGKLAYKIQDALISDRLLPKYLKNSYLRNICSFYRPQMTSYPGRPETVVKTYMQLTHPHNHHVMNISIIPYDGLSGPDWLHHPEVTVLGLVRTVNYLIKNGGYVSMHEDKKIRTITYLCWFDRELQLLKQLQVRLAVDYPKCRYMAIENFEDMRLFRYLDGDIGFVATGIDTHDLKSHQMVMGTFNSWAEINSVTLLHYADWRFQKNWLPFLANDQLLLVYKYAPFTLIKPDTLTGDCELVLETSSKLDLASLRGSAAPVNCAGWFEDTEYSEAHWIMTVHSSVRREDGRTAYINKFLLLTEDFHVYRISRYYKLTGENVEYSMGCLILDNKLAISYSQDDRLGCLAMLTRKQVLSCFQ
uniref:Uncharacterized protein n=1 Tax=Pithovirus LCPAC103 TaxID=2506588 RepID=A0A481Z3J3_9VIRU|nr:MAG: hypothetical protein LCPAC103_00880 [Pithovirus LCPAC103]